jgi:polysaccharide biosynthesis protein PslG
VGARQQQEARRVTHRPPRLVAALLAGLALAALAAWAPAAPAAERSPVASLQDDRLALPSVAPAPRMKLMADLGARVIRVDLRWDLVARSRPANAVDPADPAYDWRHYDAVVAAARANRVQVLFTVWGTPAWAADPGVPRDSYPANATQPADPADFAAFGAAAAARYAPRGVHLWEAWNEPNIPLFLRPQYRRQGGGWVAVSPTTYSRLLRGFYRAVKTVDGTATIGGAVTAPVGDQCPSSCPDSADNRVTPTAFLRGLAAPGNRPPMDVYSHHPYPITGPREVSFAGANYIDLYNLDRLTRAIDRTYLRGKRLWLTEIGFSTRPVKEYPTAFSERQQAQYLADAYRRLLGRRIALTTWFFLQDNAQWTSGLLRLNGSRKPAFDAFALPVAPTRSTPIAPGARVRVVGQARRSRGPTTVVLEANEGGWRAVGRVRTSADGSFTATLRPRATTTYRARWVGADRTGAPARRTSPPFVVSVRTS